MLGEPEPDACRAAVRLFGVPVVRADATALPFSDASAGIAWCLRRAVHGGRHPRPAGDAPRTPPRHPSRCEQLHELFGQADLEAVEVASFRDLTQPPPVWTARVKAVEDERHRRYGHTPELTAADEQSDRIGKLLNSGQLTSQVILLVPAR